MSLYEKLNTSITNRDVDTYLSLLHDDFAVTFHKSGKSFSKGEWAEILRDMMSNEKFVQDSSRCVYENDDIMVEHSFMSYPDNTKEAVMLIAMLKNGKIIRMETGATRLE